MWILECDGDLLGGKRRLDFQFTKSQLTVSTGKKMWLKPGQQYLFGRNKVENNERTCATIGHIQISVALD